MGCGLFLLSCGGDSGRYDRTAQGTALVPNETQSPLPHASGMSGRSVAPRVCPPPPISLDPPLPRAALLRRFAPQATADQRAMIIAACFALDYAYFECKNEPSTDNGGGGDGGDW